MSDVAAWPAPRLPAERDLDRAELGDVAGELGRERTVWEHLVRHDPDELYFVQPHRDVHLDVWPSAGRTNRTRATSATTTSTPRGTSAARP